MKILIAVLRGELGAVFLYACASKLFHPAEFADMVMGYRIVPSEFLTLVATVLPCNDNSLASWVASAGLCTLPETSWVAAAIWLIAAAT